MSIVLRMLVVSITDDTKLVRTGTSRPQLQTFQHETEYIMRRDQAIFNFNKNTRKN